MASVSMLVKKIQTAFAEVESKGITSFDAIGLDSSAMKQIVQSKVPSDQSLNALVNIWVGWRSLENRTETFPFFYAAFTETGPGTFFR